MKNKETLLKLFDKFLDEIYEMTEEEEKIAKKMSKIQNKLWKTMNKEQKRFLEKWLYCESDRSYEVSKQSFIYAFSLAMNIFTESLKIDNKKSE